VPNGPSERIQKETREPTSLSLKTKWEQGNTVPTERKGEAETGAHMLLYENPMQLKGAHMPFMENGGDRQEGSHRLSNDNIKQREGAQMPLKQDTKTHTFVHRSL
jgi:hypothetical protein